jgi:S-DNA-T family DNA segregation ATPase FtsK/SpoIIIE
VTLPATRRADDTDASTAPLLEEIPGDDPTRPQARPGAMMPARFNISLAIVGGDRAGEVVRLERSSCVIGRAGPDATADLRIDDPTLSRAHATVECVGGLVLLRDLGSHNGTFVDEKRVETATLEDRAEFRLGRTCFMLILTAKE